jgi:hypothetical protein
MLQLVEIRRFVVGGLMPVQSLPNAAEVVGHFSNGPLQASTQQRR